MRETQKEVTTLKTVYIAKDGREFFDEFECKNYERDIDYELAIARMAKIPHFVTNSSDLHMYNGDEDEIVWVIIPRSADDMDIIKTVQEFSGYCVENTATCEPIGKPLAIRFGCDGRDCDVYDLYEVLSDAVTDINRAITCAEHANNERRGESNGQ